MTIPVDQTGKSNTQESSEALAFWYAIYTRHGAEDQIARLLKDWGYRDTLVPRLSRTVESQSSVPGTELLFTNYVFIYCQMDTALYGRINEQEHVVRVVGTRPGEPSVIPEGEIELLRMLLQCNPRILADELVPGGDEAEIVTGAMRGVRGRILNVVNTRALMVVSLPIVGKMFELYVPLAHLVILDKIDEASAGKKRHRGGRRMRRSRGWNADLPDGGDSNGD